jgi:uncharacterized protein YecE (DUF72 family)
MLGAHARSVAAHLQVLGVGCAVSKDPARPYAREGERRGHHPRREAIATRAHLMPSNTPQFRIGISGWIYGQWRKVFYPKDLPHKRELAYASRMLNSIEINGSFYSLQRPSSYQKWYDVTPPGFVFSLKGGRYITHMRKLKEVEQPLANYFASGVLALKEKLGPILWQFPPNFGFDAARFNAFFKLLPRDTKAAAELARGHDPWMKDRALTETDANRPIRHAVEIRHPSFEQPEFIALLRKHKIALVFADTAGRWPYSEDLTADFVYVRLHGDEELYASGYSPSALDWWAKRMRAWARGAEPSDARRWSEKTPAKRASRDVYAYFDNDVKVRAPFDAMALADRLGSIATGVDRTAPIATPTELPSRTFAPPRTRWPGERKNRIA